MTASELADLLNGLPGNTEVQISLLPDFEAMHDTITGRWVSLDSRLEVKEVLYRHDSRVAVVKVF